MVAQLLSLIARRLASAVVIPSFHSPSYRIIAPAFAPSPKAIITKVELPLSCSSFIQDCCSALCHFGTIIVVFRLGSSFKYLYSMNRGLA
jgi:hypothetical protein